jgi:hypothetical protein
MIKIKQLLREIEEDKNSNIASVEDEKEWKWPDVDHMFNMKFEREGDSVFVLENPPIKVYKMKKGPFVLEEPIENHEDHDPKKGVEAPIKPRGLTAFTQSKGVKKHQFPTFTKLISFFDKYDQGL